MDSPEFLTTYGFLATYAEGWVNGDAETVVGALADGYVLDDPNYGRVAKHEMETYFTDLRERVCHLRGGAAVSTLMRLSDLTTKEDDELLVAWTWWEIPGTNLEGSGLMKITLEGVISERLTYYTGVDRWYPGDEGT